jgi:hypothetical protein
VVASIKGNDALQKKLISAIVAAIQANDSPKKNPQ